MAATLNSDENPVPTGWDARCKGCNVPYTFGNAQHLKVADWKHYCSNLCAAPKPKNRWCPTCGHILR